MTSFEHKIYSFLGDVLSLQSQPDESAEQLSQVLYGEQLHIVDIDRDWKKCEHIESGLTGFLRSDELSENLVDSTHVVNVPYAYLYERPEHESPTTRILSMNSHIQLTGQSKPLIFPSGSFSATVEELSSGEWIITKAVDDVGQYSTDPFLIANQLMNTPYLYGGRSYLGLDEGGLIEVVLRRCGFSIPHMRENELRNYFDGLSEDHQLLKFLKSQNFDFDRLGFVSDDHQIIYASTDEMCVVNQTV